MMTTYDFLGSEAISHLNSVKGIIGHLEERTRTGDEDARRVLDSLGYTLSQFSFLGCPATGKNLNPQDGSSRLHGSPASANNMQQPAPPQSPDLPDLNYFAPKKNLQVMLCGDWFDKVCADKKIYTTSWREKLIEALMMSEYRIQIARTWENRSLRLQLKGHVIGALITAGVIKNKALAVARTFYNTNENTAEVKTLAKYMGDSRKEYYTDWIVDYVKSQQPIEK